MNKETINLRYLTGGGITGEMIRSKDWTDNPLGSPETWPQSLRTIISTCLNSKFPILIFWGNHYTMLYNDAYFPLIGQKHPSALGQSAGNVLPEIWDTIEPMLKGVYESGEPTWSENQLFFLDRSGYLEECYFTFSYSPIYVESGDIGGVFCAVTETTQILIKERQNTTLQHLSNLKKVNNTTEDVFKEAAIALEKNNKDFPFAIIYKINDENKLAQPISYAGIEKNQNVFPKDIDLIKPVQGTYNFCKAFETNTLVISENNGRRKNLPKGAWQKEATHFIHIPITYPGNDYPHAILSSALNPYREFNQSYRDFAQSIAEQLSLEINSALLYEKEKKSEEKFRTLAETLPQLVWITDAEGKQEYASKRWAEYTGLDPKDENTFERMVHPDDLVNLIFARTKSLETGAAYSAEARLKNRKGEFRWHSVQGEPIRNSENKIIKWIGAFNDIHENRMFASQMQESEEKFRTLADSIQNLAWMADGSGYIFWYNQRWYDYTGTNLEEMKGWGWEKVHHPDHVNRVVEYVTAAWQTNVPFELTFPLKGKDGIYRWFLTRGVPIVNDDGIVTRWIGTNTDIDEQKKAEEEFRNLADNAPMWVWIANKNAYVTYANKEFLNFIGLGDPDQFTEQAWEKYMHPDDVKDTYKMFETAFEKQQPYTMECRFKNAKTEEFEWMLIKGVPRFANTIFTGFIGTSINIHQEKKQIQSLEESTNKFKNLLETLPQMTWTNFPNGEVNFYNQVWYNYTGLTFEQTKEWGWQSVVHPEDLITTLKACAKALKGNLFIVENRYKKHDGSYRWHLNRALPIKNEDGEIVLWVGTATDIQDQKEHSENLKSQVFDRTRDLKNLNSELEIKNAELINAEHFLETVLNSSVELVASFDKDLNYTFINKKVEEFLGKNREEIIGKNVIDVSPGIEKTKQYDRLLRSLKGENIHVQQKTAFAKKDITLETFLLPFKKGEEIEGVITLQRDVTSFINLTENLKDTNAELARSNADLQQFAHVASHDLKEPLRKIKLYTSRIHEDYTSLLPELAKEHMEKITHATTRMQMMIDGVLTYSSITASREDFQSINLNEVIKNVLSDLEINIKEKDAKINVSPLPTIEGVEIQLYQLFYNLIKNALKFSKPDQVSLINIVEETIVQKKNTFTKISISDNGIGFDPQFAEKIFETFVRLNSKDRYEGTGLGLSLCKKIIMRHHGKIEAVSVEGQGATFIISLPLIQNKTSVNL